MLIQAGPYGSTCARVGGMPSKVLLQVAHDFHRRHVLGQESIYGHNLRVFTLGGCALRTNTPGVPMLLPAMSSSLKNATPAHGQERKEHRALFQ